MKTHIKKLQFLAVTCVVLFAALYMWSRSAAGQKEVKLPKVVSEAKNIEVVNVKVIGQHSLVVTLRNKSEKPVVAVTLESGDSRDADGVTAAGYKEGDEPDSIIIRPHDTYDMDIPLSYLRPDWTVKVKGVIYADDTGEGDKDSVEMMHKQKTHLKSKDPKQGKGGPR